VRGPGRQVVEQDEREGGSVSLPPDAAELLECFASNLTAGRCEQDDQRLFAFIVHCHRHALRVDVFNLRIALEASAIGRRTDAYAIIGWCVRTVDVGLVLLRYVDEMADQRPPA
jgi:hypothetical protein